MQVKDQVLRNLEVHTFDIETLGWSEPIAVGLFDGTNYKDFLKDSPDDEVIWKFLEYARDYYGKVTLYAHNSTSFDNKFILECLIRHKQTVDMPAGLGSLRWIEGKIAFRDTYPLLRTSLDRACEAFGIDRKLNWDHKKTVNTWEMSSDRLQVFRAYLERDCRALSGAYTLFVKELLETFDIQEPGSTLGQTALKIYDALYNLDTIDSNQRYHLQIRKALYGGRNEIYNRYGENLQLYDIRSMYVSCYNTDIPIGEMKFLGKREIGIDRGTLAYAKVHVPEDWFIGPLPYHIGTSLLFPVGKFEGWWDMVELRYAYGLGVKVDIEVQLECDEIPALEEFGQTMLRLRQQATEAENYELTRLWKALGVQLVGKFAQNSIRTKIKHISTFETLSSMEGWTFIDTDEQYLEGERLINSALKKYLSKTLKPAVAMRIRAEARIRHHKAMLEAEEEVGPEGLYYCDTDSVYTTANLQCGDLPGDLQLIGKALRAYFIMRKFYGFVNSEGTLRQRSSGFSGYKLTEKQFSSLLDGEELRIVTPGSTLTAPGDLIRGKEAVSIHKERSIRTSTVQNREIVGLTTKPIVLT